MFLDVRDKECWALARAWQEWMDLYTAGAFILKRVLFVLCDLIYPFVTQSNITIEKSFILSIGPPCYGERDCPI